ncbi:MAG: M14 family metallopeptidase [Pseudomonadota bacterium]
MDIESYFSANYQEGRAKFLALCEDQGFSVTSHRNERAQAPDGSDLFLDLATLGAADASQLLMVFSGTHGVEGYCGSGIQAALLGEGFFRDAGPDLQVALVHAVNPYGFAHDRRVNEDNIDLNRNFLEFGKDTPRNIGYGDIHKYLVPDAWEGETRKQADTALAQYAKQNGPDALQHAASGGQYTHSDGVFYGGEAPSWSANTVLSLVKPLAAQATRACFIDIHTGLGPYGYGEMIAAGFPAQVARTEAFYSDYEVTDPEAGTSSSAPIQGTMAHGIERLLPGVETQFLALEYGTLPMKEVMTAVRADNWLYRSGSLDSDLGKQIKQQIRDAFYCDEAQWKTMVHERAVDVLSTTLSKLQAA